MLIDQDGHCKLADFGLSKENMGDKDVTKSFCGTPEIIENYGVSRASDIYQIGAVLYEFLIGCPPHYN